MAADWTRSRKSASPGRTIDPSPRLFAATQTGSWRRAGTDQINQIVALQMAVSHDPEAPYRTSTFMLDQAEARKIGASLLECANELKVILDLSRARA